MSGERVMGGGIGARLEPGAGGRVRSIDEENRGVQSGSAGERARRQERLGRFGAGVLHRSNQESGRRHGGPSATIKGLPTTYEEDNHLIWPEG